MRDSGAVDVMDFTEIGHGSTAQCSKHELIGIFRCMVSHLANCSPDVMVLEIADGIAQRETRMLLELLSERNQPLITVCAVGDAFCIPTVEKTLQGLSLNLVGFSGRVTRTPLSFREAATQTHRPIWETERLASPAARELLSMFGPEAKSSLTGTVAA